LGGGKLHGRLLAERLTSMQVARHIFLGGVVCYSNEMKTAVAERAEELIKQRRGERRKWRSLAEGIRRRVGSTIGVGLRELLDRGGSEEKTRGLDASGAGERKRSERTRGRFRAIAKWCGCRRRRLRWNGRMHFLYNGVAKRGERCGFLSRWIF